MQIDTFLQSMGNIYMKKALKLYEAWFNLGYLQGCIKDNILKINDIKDLMWLYVNPHGINGSVLSEIVFLL